jgi:hypothetical protein
VFAVKRVSTDLMAEEVLTASLSAHVNILLIDAAGASAAERKSLLSLCWIVDISPRLMKKGHITLGINQRQILSSIHALTEAYVSDV